MTVSMDTVDLPTGETISYRERGGGTTPLVLLHGNLTSSKHFDVVFDAMDEHFKLYAMDMRGFGGSTYETPIDGLEDLAADVVPFADAMGLDSFHLAGWSTGGAVGMVVAASAPDRVQKLVLIEPVSTRGWPIYALDEHGEPTNELLTTREELTHNPLVQIMDSGDRDAMREGMWDTFVYTHNQPDPDRYEEYLEDTFTQRNLVDVFHGLVHFNISDEPTEAAEGTGDAARIDAPTLVLWGERDQVITEEMARTTVADIGENADLVVLSDCGHSPFIDDIDQLLDEVTRFLGR